MTELDFHLLKIQARQTANELQKHLDPLSLVQDKCVQLIAS